MTESPIGANPKACNLSRGVRFQPTTNNQEIRYREKSIEESPISDNNGSPCALFLDWEEGF